jgi:Rieske Fe-S protein
MKSDSERQTGGERTGETAEDGKSPNRQSHEGISRRHFLLLAAAATAAANPNTVSGRTPSEQLVDAGPLTNYSADGLYDHFRDLGFFVIRKGDKLIALSSTCTHRKCTLKAERDHSFYCKCHGSTFDPSGKVTEGPATRDLPTLATVTEKGHLVVKVPT